MKRLLLGNIGIALVCALAGAAELEAQATFFGEDLSADEAHLGAFPNSNAAEADFLSYLEGVGTETFDGIPDGTGNPVLSFPGAGSATLNGTGSVQDESDACCGRYGISSPNFYEADAGGGFGIDFSDPVAAFGFYGVDIGDFGGQLFLEFMYEGGDTEMLAVDHTIGSSGSTGGSVFFFGFINTARQFSSVEFQLMEGPEGDVFAFDDMTIGSVEQVTTNPTVTPEPLSMVLLGTGLFGVGVVGRKRRNGLEDADAA